MEEGNNEMGICPIYGVEVRMPKGIVLLECELCEISMSKRTQNINLNICVRAPEMTQQMSISAIVHHLSLGRLRLSCFRNANEQRKAKPWPAKRLQTTQLMFKGHQGTLIPGIFPKSSALLSQANIPQSNHDAKAIIRIHREPIRVHREPIGKHREPFWTQRSSR